MVLILYYLFICMNNISLNTSTLFNESYGKYDFITHERELSKCL